MREPMTRVGDIAEVPMLARMMSGLILGALGASHVGVWIRQDDGSHSFLAGTDREATRVPSVESRDWPLVVEAQTFGYLRVEADVSPPPWTSQMLAEVQEHADELALGLYQGIRWQRVELALRAREAANARSPVMVRATEDGAIIDVDDAVHQFTGWSPEQLRGAPIEQLLPRIGALSMQAASSQAPHRPCRFRCADGRDGVGALRCVNARAADSSSEYLLLLEGERAAV